jgi:hypothetical protein
MLTDERKTVQATTPKRTTNIPREKENFFIIPLQQLFEF